MISEFYIKGLFGERNVNIPFESSYKIIVAENGCGKTTVLNCLYALLSGNISKLRKVSFSKIGIIFVDGVEISFNKAEFEVGFKNNPFFEHLESELGQEFISALLDDIRNYPSHEIELSPLFQKASRNIGVSTRMLRGMLREERRNTQISTKTQNKLDNIFTTVHFLLPHSKALPDKVRQN